MDLCNSVDSQLIVQPVLTGEEQTDINNAIAKQVDNANMPSAAKIKLTPEVQLTYPVDSDIYTLGQKEGNETGMQPGVNATDLTLTYGAAAKNFYATKKSGFLDRIANYIYNNFYTR